MPAMHGARVGAATTARRAPPAPAARARRRSRRSRARARRAPAESRRRPARAQPLEHRAGREHAAVERVLDLAADPPRHRRQEAAGGARDVLARRGRGRTRRSRRSPSPGRARRSPRPPAPPAGRPPGAQQRQLDRPVGSWRSVPSSPGAVADLAAAPRAGRRSARTARGPSRASPSRLQLRARGGRGVGGEARPEPVAQERVDRAHPQRAGVAAPAGPLRSCSSSHASLPAEKYGSSGSPLRSRISSSSRAQPVEHLLRALVLPDHDRATAARRSRRPTRAPTRPGGRARTRRPRRVGVREQLARPPPRRAASDPRTVLLHPACPRVAVHLVAPRLATGRRRSSKQGRLDAGRALVDRRAGGDRSS